MNSAVRPDREGQSRRRAQARAPSGVALGKRSLYVPMMHKDMYYRAGKVSTCGSKIRRDFTPGVTATALQRLDAAGAIDMGTLNMAEFAQNPTGHTAHFNDQATIRGTCPIAPAGPPPVPGRRCALLRRRLWGPIGRVDPPAGLSARHRHQGDANLACRAPASCRCPSAWTMSAR